MKKKEEFPPAYRGLSKKELKELLLENMEGILCFPRSDLVELIGKAQNCLQEKRERMKPKEIRVRVKDLKYGDYVRFEGEKGLLVFVRRKENGDFVFCNNSSKSVIMSIDGDTQVTLA